MNSAVVLSFVRQILTFGGGILVGNGYLDQATMTEVVGALAVLISTGWSFVTHRATA